MQTMHYAQTDTADTGTLRTEVVSTTDNLPIEGARIQISYSGDPTQQIEEVSTDESGMSEAITLNTPPIEYSMSPGENQPFSQYTIQVSAPGYRPFTVSGIQVLPEELSLQRVRLTREEASGSGIDTITIPLNTLYGNFPPKIPESEIKPVSESGEIVLSRVVIPEYIVVHDGPPSDPNAANYYVRYKDYIKNVASSEIYATWPDSTIRANVLAIMSFTLNRIYTEW